MFPVAFCPVLLGRDCPMSSRRECRRPGARRLGGRARADAWGRVARRSRLHRLHRLRPRLYGWDYRITGTMEPRGIFSMAVPAEVLAAAMACVGGPAAGRGARRRRDLWRSSASRVAVTSKPLRPVENFGMPRSKEQRAPHRRFCSQIWDVALARHTDTRTDRQNRKLAPPAKRGCGKYGRTRYFNAGG